ncbi:hypothetical protein PFISCL1PPCAC_22200, partial [Pristionchus fissidentatus]
LYLYNSSFQTFISLAHLISLVIMWLFGDMMPKRALFFVALSCWIAFGLASLLASAGQFWLFVLLKTAESMSNEICLLSVAVLQAERFNGKMLTLSIMCNVVALNVGNGISITANSFFLASGTDWKLASLVVPVSLIPSAILTSFFLKATESSGSTRSVSLLSNALGMLRSKSYVLIVIAQSMGLFYAMSFAFWLPSLTLDAFETFPNIFTGLSYPAATSLISNIGAVGIVLAIPILAYFSKYFSSSSLVVPITLALAGTITRLCFLGQITMISVNFPITVLSFFGDGFIGFPFAVVSQQIIINLAPAHHRTSAISLLRLTEAVVRIPAFQLVGWLSDSFRGDATTSYAQFYGLRNALLCVWSVNLPATICYILVIRYYREDVAKAQESGRRHKVQSTPLISRKSTDISIDARII